MPAGEVRNKINENPVEIRTKRSKEHEDRDKGNIVVEIVDKPEPINLVDKGELEKKDKSEPHKHIPPGHRQTSSERRTPRYRRC